MESAAQLSRAYSWDVGERLRGNEAARDLAVLVSQDRNNVTAPWQALYEEWVPEEGSAALIPLKEEAKQLRSYFDVFQSRLPQYERIQWDVNLENPSIDRLTQMIEDVSNAWQQKRERGFSGKFMKYFHKVCGTLHAHGNLIKIIPQGNTYAGLFSGALTAIIAASANHENVAKGLAAALLTISEHIAACSAELDLYKTEKMQVLVADLYAHIFLLLQDIMKWYIKRSARRLLDSFQEKLHDHFQEEIDNVRNKSEVIRREAARSSAGELRATRLVTEETHRDLRLGLKGVARLQLEQSYENKRIERTLLRNSEALCDIKRSLDQLLQQQAQGWLYSRQDSGSHSPYVLMNLIEAPTAQRQNATDDTQTPSGSMWRRDDILEASKALKDFFERDRVQIVRDHSKSRPIPSDAVVKVKSWIQNDDARILSISGPFSDKSGQEQPMTWLAAMFVDLASDARATVLSYFCPPQRGIALRGHNTKEIQLALSVLYSLIRQAIEFLPVEFTTEVDLSPERFSALDGDQMSWGPALAILHDLLPWMHKGSSFCVIDGFQRLDDGSVAAWIHELLNELRSSKLKILITTTGRSRILSRELSNREHVLLHESKLIDQPTKSLLGLSIGSPPQQD